MIMGEGRKAVLGSGGAGVGAQPSTVAALLALALDQAFLRQGIPESYACGYALPKSPPRWNLHHAREGWDKAPGMLLLPWRWGAFIDVPVLTEVHQAAVLAHRFCFLTMAARGTKTQRLQTATCVWAWGWGGGSGDWDYAAKVPRNSCLQ